MTLRRLMLELHLRFWGQLLGTTGSVGYFFAVVEGFNETDSSGTYQYVL